MRSILEQAIIHHLNGDEAKAQDSFHQFIVTRARQIHESMRNGDEPEDNWDDKLTSEEYFNESDLAELETLEDEPIDDDAGEDVDGEFDGEAFDAEDGDEVAADELGDDMGIEDEELSDEEGDVEEKIEDMDAHIAEIEEKLEELLAQFDAANDFDDEDAVEDDMEPVDDEFQTESDDADMDDEDFTGLGESITSELEKVAAINVDATEVGAGSKISANTKSTLPQKPAASRQGGSPVQTKGAGHKGFDREAAPAVAPLKKRRNNVDTAKAALSPVAKK